MSPHPSALPPNPSLNLLANLAKGLRKAQSAGDPEAIRRFLTHHPKYVSSDSSTVSDATFSQVGGRGSGRRFSTSFACWDPECMPGQILRSASQTKGFQEDGR